MSDLAGTYYQGDGTGYNVLLTLDQDGTYTAEWHGCFGIYGKAAGRWTLTTNQVLLHPSRETDMMREHLRALDVFRHKSHWILVRASEEDRQWYAQRGVARCTCFQLRSVLAAAEHH